MRTPRKKSLTPTALIAAVLLSGCGGDDDKPRAETVTSPDPQNAQRPYRARPKTTPERTAEQRESSKPLASPSDRGKARQRPSRLGRNDRTQRAADLAKQACGRTRDQAENLRRNLENSAQTAEQPEQRRKRARSLAQALRCRGR